MSHSDQFEDAPEDSTPSLTIQPDGTFGAVTSGANTATPLPGSRQDGVAYIDEVDEGTELSKSPGALSEDVIPPFQRLAVHQVAREDADVVEGAASEVEVDDEEYEDEDGYDFQEVEIDDEDWEVADADFTKQYNRMRQHQQALTAASSTSMKATSSAVPLPARNISRSRAAVPSAATSTASRTKLAPLATATATLPGVSSAPKAAYTKANQKDKADRATQEQVLDPRTKNVLASLVRKGLVESVGGCVSTGKEANVYHGTSPSTPPVSSNPSSPYPSPYPDSIALKVYKTSILSFKSRSAYMVGEHRLKNAYTAVSNPRKMVRTWAEKELRNLRRLGAGGINAPRVVEVRENVLVMEFLGDVDGKPSPRLKDAEIPSSQLAELYAELLVAMRWMYHRCKIVHADLSEYNILYHDSHLYIIDVSQSVEHDHPSSFDFLRKDIQNVNDYFERRSGGAVRTLGGRGTFDFVVNEVLQDGEGVAVEDETEEGLKDVIRKWLERGVGLASVQSTGGTGDGSADSSKTGFSNAGVDDKVFMSSYIPRSLAEVYDPERDTAKLTSGGGDDLIYSGVTGIGDVTKSKKEDQEPEVLAVHDSETAGQSEPRTVRFEDDSDDDEELSTEAEDDTGDRKPRGFRHEDREAKKDRKKSLKEEKREKRKTKMPKSEKAKMIKKSSHGK